MTTDQLLQKWGASLGVLGYSDTIQGIEEFRESVSGTFGNRTGTKYKRDNGKLVWEPTSNWEYSDNIVVNQGLDYLLDVALSGGTQIAAADWQITLNKTATSPVAGDTYASRGWTEIAGSDVTETVREEFGDNAVSGQSISNGTAAQYTANATFTAYGAALLGGGASPNTIGDTAGGGTLYAASDFSTSKALTASDTIDVTYTLTTADG